MAHPQTYQLRNPKTDQSSPLTLSDNHISPETTPVAKPGARKSIAHT